MSAPLVRMLGGACVLAALATTAAARAQDAAAAEALFREGRALLDKGDVAAACDKLAESQRLDASSGTLLNLAVCHEKQGKTATAWAEFLGAARLASTQGRQERAEEARRRAADLEGTLSRLTVDVAETIPGLEVRRDEVVLETGSLGSAIPTDPGPHRITASAPGHESFSTSVMLGPRGDLQRVAVPKLVPSAAETPAPPAASAASPPPERTETAPARRAAIAPDSGESGGQRTLGWVVTGAGAAVLAAGATFGVLSLSAYKSAERACPSHAGCSEGALSDAHTANVRANVANVGVPLGLVGVGAGIFLVLTAKESPARPRGAVDADVHVTPALGREGVGVACSGAF